jgi:hypothetical protein
MEMGYWITAGKIYGPVGFTGYFIDPTHRIIGRRGYTKHWIYQNHIYAAGIGNTGYHVEENRILGPEPEPPWERQTH